MKSGVLIKQLERRLDTVALRGSHQQFMRTDLRWRVTVPRTKKELPIGTVKAILKQTGLK